MPLVPVYLILFQISLQAVVSILRSMVNFRLVFTLLSIRFQIPVKSFLCFCDFLVLQWRLHLICTVGTDIILTPLSCISSSHVHYMCGFISRLAHFMHSLCSFTVFVYCAGYLDSRSRRTAQTFGLWARENRRRRYYLSGTAGAACGLTKAVISP